MNNCHHLSYFKISHLFSTPLINFSYLLFHYIDLQHVRIISGTFFFITDTRPLRDITGIFLRCDKILTACEK
jgi:hypothetical protein